MIMKHSEEWCKQHSKRMSGKNHPFYGKKRPEHSEGMKGKNNPMFGKKRPDLTKWNGTHILKGKLNGNWRGEKVGLVALHNRVRVVKGNPVKCEFCGENKKGLRYEWANMTGNYFDIDDYRSLCVSCHRKYDSKRRK